MCTSMPFAMGVRSEGNEVRGKAPNVLSLLDIILIISVPSSLGPVRAL